MKLFSYVVTRDFGFAPNPFFGVCTLATCKPEIRRVAQLDDWVVGTGSKRHSREKNIVYAMRVTDTMTFGSYWSSEQFQCKKPNLQGSKKQAFGDNIYHREAARRKWCQSNSHHSLPNGKPNMSNVVTDTKTDRVLISLDFVYWGGLGPVIPAKFLKYGTNSETICAHRGHRSIFSEKFRHDFIAWIRSTGEKGFLGDPYDWRYKP